MSVSENIAISNKIDELEKVSFFLEEFCEANEIPMKIANSFQIVLDELISNTIFYGFKKSAKGKIEIYFSYENNNLTALLIDNGKKYDPHNAPAPDILNNDVENKKIGGLGIHIVKKMMDTFVYERKDDKNYITISKHF